MICRIQFLRCNNLFFKMFNAVLLFLRFFKGIKIPALITSQRFGQTNLKNKNKIVILLPHNKPGHIESRSYKLR